MNKTGLQTWVDMYNKADKERFEALLQRDRYKKALDEIEEYIYSDCEYNDGCDRNICMKCKYSSIHDKRILQLIKQAKEGNNEI